LSAGGQDRFRSSIRFLRARLPAAHFVDRLIVGNVNNQVMSDRGPFGTISCWTDANENILEVFFGPGRPNDGIANE